eukprot:maker-scaffold572_size133628-snap-gene-0.11 protein:Tk01141 transcript:maker-scaffold572_size133628-snap-gene-0.11-mRNA-1 annotation:"similar to H28G03.4"
MFIRSPLCMRGLATFNSRLDRAPSTVKMDSSENKRTTPGLDLQIRRNFRLLSSLTAFIFSRQELRRKVIADLHAAGNDAATIVKVTNYPKRTVYDVVKRLKDGRGIEHKPCGPHKAKKRTKTFLAGLKRSIKANPAVSIRAHAARRGLSRKTMAKAIKEDLGLTSYVRGRRHLLTEKMKAVRLERSRKLRRICKSNPGVVRLFSDESIFTVDGAYNPQNDRERKLLSVTMQSLIFFATTCLALATASPLIKQGDIYAGCGEAKNCWGVNADGGPCVETMDCNLVVSWVNNGGAYDFELQSANAENAWVALGFSRDGEMGDDSDNTGLTAGSSNNDNGVYCSFTHAASLTFLTPVDPAEEVTFDLDSESFYLLLSSGQLDADGVIDQHNAVGISEDLDRRTNGNGTTRAQRTETSNRFETQGADNGMHTGRVQILVLQV